MQQQMYLQEFSVAYQYQVFFTNETFAKENTVFREALASREPNKRHRVLFIVEQAVADANPQLVADMEGYVKHHESSLVLAGPSVLIDGGEDMKNTLELPEQILRRVNELAIDRHSYIAIVGGGALQDAAGYAAAIAHRGVRVVRLPTTVLGQADSGVGVKNGVNYFGKKNFVGTFSPPFAVINDAALLESLSRRDKIAGMSEAVKVSLIRDLSFFQWIQEHARELAACEPEPMAYLIRRSAELHMRHIATSGDAFEYGSARPLDFGHWAAHKLETLTNHRLRHGEAVAIGVALDTYYSSEIGLLTRDAAMQVIEVLEKIGFRLWDDGFDLKGEGGRPRVFDGLAEFREHLGGELTITLLQGLGRGLEVHEIDDEAMLRSMQWLRERDREKSRVHA